MKKRKKILLVEDEKLILEALSTKLKSEGFEVFTARDGVAGLEMAVQYIPDLILLDIVMPRMDGITVLKKLRENKRVMNIPVIIWSNMDDIKTVSDALKSGTYDFLIKSDWNIEKVVEKIKQKLKVK